MERTSGIAIEIINNLHTERLNYDSEYIPLINCANQCAAYEDTGLEPEEIPTGIELANVFAALEKLKQYEAIGTVEQIKKLTQMEKMLSLDELQKMDGEPVWVKSLLRVDLSCWGFHDEDGVCGYRMFFEDDDYGKLWEAYQWKPDELARVQVEKDG